MEDFNSRTITPPRTKNMMTGKWTRMHGDCQRCNALFYKHLTRKSGESDADLVENAKTSYMERNGPIDEDNLQDLFGPDPRERPADKQRATKKQKSVDTLSTRGSTEGSTKGSQSKSVSGVLSLDYRRKCDAAEKAYEAKREKELIGGGVGVGGGFSVRELEFLMIDHSSLPPAKRATIERKQAEIMRKYPDA
ncbi:hypothetical protein Tco_1553473 [Tanacetum coccineum]